MWSAVRKYATPFTVVLFAAVGASGLLMLVGIHSRPLHVWHQWLGAAFVTFGLLHVFHNGRGFLALSKLRRTQIVYVLLGAVSLYLLVAGGQEAQSGGDNPRVAQMLVMKQLTAAPISQVAPIFGLSEGDAVARLRKGGLTVHDAGQSLAAVTQNTQVSTQQALVLFLNGRGAGGGHR